MGFFATCVHLRGNLRVRLATQRVNLRLLAGGFGQGLSVSSPENVFVPNPVRKHCRRQNMSESVYGLIEMILLVGRSRIVSI